MNNSKKELYEQKNIVVIESVPENNIEFLRIIRTVGNLYLLTYYFFTYLSHISLY